MSNVLNNQARLYAIADMQTCQKNEIDIDLFANAFFSAGGKNLQYRDKISSGSIINANVEKLKNISDKHSGNLIINDYVEIANAYNLPVHIGWDTPQLMGNTKFPETKFGRSTHNMEEIKKANAEIPLADHIGFGAVFKSNTKKNVKVNQNDILAALKNWDKEIVFIGGITIENFTQLPNQTRCYYAVIQDFFTNGCLPENIYNYTKEFLEKITRNS